MNKYFKHLSMAAVAALAFAACSDVPELPYPFPGDDNDTTTVGGVKTLPYSESFSSSLGEWTNQTTSGEGAWINDYKTAKATGYDNASQTTTAGTYYLISPEISLEGVEEAYIAYEYILRYNKGDENQKVLIAESAEEPEWAVLNTKHTEGRDWSTFETTELNIPAEYVGKTIRIAFYYNTNNVSGSTWEVRNFSIQEGKVAESGDEPTPDDPNAVKTLPYSESFSSSLGSFVNETTSGSGEWINDYQTAKATGYDNASTTTTAGTYYLISPQISLEGVTEAHVAYEYILRYNKGDENQKVLISADYTDDATMATWAVLKADHTEGTDWVTFESADINIPAEYMGKTIRIAFYYNTNAESGSTWEVRNFAIAEGKTSEGGNDDNEEPVEPEGDTLSVAQAIALNDGEIHWVKGYIVGYISQSYEYTFTADANASETNLLIADSKDCTDETSCMPVQLPAGSIRSALNLKANPENLGKVLTINGQLTNYFKVPGIKSASEYKLEGKDNNDTPETPDTPTDAYYSNSLLGDEGGFAAYDINLGSLSYVWQNTKEYGWKASAYTNSAVAAESWLISPAIDLSAAKSPVMTFEQALNHLKGASRTAHVNVYIATDFAGDIAAATWQELILNEWPAGADWSFITSTTDLATYAGKSIHIAFKYVSTSAVAPTWEFKNLTIAEK